MLAAIPMVASAQLPKPGQRAKDFSLPVFDSARTETRLSSLRGHPVVISFWASWCPPCRKEMPDLAVLYQTTHGSGLEVLAVSEENLEVDAKNNPVRRSTREHDANLRAYLRQFPLPFRVLTDQNGEALTKYGHGELPIPAMVFVDSAGIIRAVFSNGLVTADSLAAGVQTIMPRH